MTAPLRRRFRALILLLVAAGPFACSRDVVRDVTLPPPQPSLALATQGTDSAGHETRALALFDGGTGLVVGSFRVAVHYDTSQVTFTGATVSDTLTVAVHDAGGRVVIAGASARGFGAGEWLRLGFEAHRARDVRASLRLEILELGDLRGGDLRSRVVATPQPTGAR